MPRPNLSILIRAFAGGQAKGARVPESETEGGGNLEVT
jgi:hypothetical protein